MRFGSVCSGIEAASVAWNPLGWEAAWLAEIEPFPSAVLAHHYPDVTNLGDMTKIAAMVDAGEIEAPDLFCGGCPCQSFSVAGMRKSLGDDRGNLTLEFIRIADAIDRVRRNTGKPPVWVFYENVPGILSTKDNAFGSFLGGLCGDEYAIDAPTEGWPSAGVVAGPSRVVAWRTLDAQFFGVAQRRKRVFVLALGGAGKWACADALLPISNSLQGHPAPSRQAGQAVTPTIRAGAANGGAGHGARSGDSKDELIVPVTGTLSARTSGGGGLGADFELAGGLIAGTLQASGKAAGSATQQDAESGMLVPMPHAAISPALKARDHKGVSSDGDGDGDGAILVPMSVALRGWDGGATAELGDELAFALRASSGGGDKPHAMVPTAYRTAGDGAVFEEGDRTAPLTTGTDPCANVIGFAQNQRDEVRMMDVAGALAAEPGAKQQTYLAYTTKLHNTQSNQAGKIYEEYTVGLDRNSPPPALLTAMQVRRLTPRECERLQSFPDDYTLIPNVKIKKVNPAKLDQDFLKYLMRGGTKTQEECMRSFADGPRYKALGNSWCVNNVRWIGERIDAVALVNIAQPATKPVAELETT